MVIAASMQSCEGPAGPEGPMGPMGPAGQDGSFYFINKEFTIASDHWVDDGEGFIYTMKVPELTAEVCETAVINVYCYYGDYQKQLPFVTFHQMFKDERNPETGEITSVPYRWTRNISYDFNEGEITFCVFYSDFDSERPETLDFRLVVHY